MRIIGRTWVFVFASTSLAASRVVTATAPVNGQRPVLAVARASQDDGTVEEGTVLHYRFTIANRGGAVLRILQVKPNCECAVPRWDKLIKPGTSGAIEVEVRTEHLRGPILKHLTVASNDPGRPEIELSLTARITPLVQVTPGTIALLAVEDRPATQEFILERTGGRPMRILQVIPARPFLNTKLTRLPGQGRYQLSVTASTQTPVGRSPTMVFVKTDLPRSPDLTLSLIVDRGIVPQPIMVFWSLPGGKLATPTRSMVTLNRAKGMFHVTGVTTGDPKLPAKLETVRQGLEYRVTLTYAGGWKPGVVKRTLTVRTDDLKQREIKVPIQAVVQGSTAALATAAAH